MALLGLEAEMPSLVPISKVAVAKKTIQSAARRCLPKSRGLAFNSQLKSPKSRGLARLDLS
jgi:hypothetical protein